MAYKMGIESKVPPLPSITLGSNEVSLLELTKSYAVIANDGYAVTPYAIETIKDNYDNIIFEYKASKSKRVLKKKINNRMKDMLRGVVVWGTGKNAELKNVEVWGKTGTSQNYRDAWFIGFTEDIVLGIWIGPDKKTTPLKITGGSYPARIFKEAMTEIYK